MIKPIDGRTVSTGTFNTPTVRWTARLPRIHAQISRAEVYTLGTLRNKRKMLDRLFRGKNLPY